MRLAYTVRVVGSFGRLGGSGAVPSPGGCGASVPAGVCRRVGRGLGVAGFARGLGSVCPGWPVGRFLSRPSLSAGPVSFAPVLVAVLLFSSSLSCPSRWSWLRWLPVGWGSWALFVGGGVSWSLCLVLVLGGLLRSFVLPRLLLFRLPSPLAGGSSARRGSCAACLPSAWSGVLLAPALSRSLPARARSVSLFWSLLAALAVLLVARRVLSRSGGVLWLLLLLSLFLASVVGPALCRPRRPSSGPLLLGLAPWAWGPAPRCSCPRRGLLARSAWLAPRVCARSRCPRWRRGLAAFVSASSLRPSPRFCPARPSRPAGPRLALPGAPRPWLAASRGVSRVLVLGVPRAVPAAGRVAAARPASLKGVSRGSSLCWSHSLVLRRRRPLWLRRLRSAGSLRGGWASGRGGGRCLVLPCSVRVRFRGCAGLPARVRAGPAAPVRDHPAVAGAVRRAGGARVLLRCCRLRVLLVARLPSPSAPGLAWCAVCAAAWLGRCRSALVLVRRGLCSAVPAGLPAAARPALGARGCCGSPAGARVARLVVGRGLITRLLCRARSVRWPRAAQLISRRPQ